MSNCSHTHNHIHKKDSSWFPITFIHDAHNHDCRCVKCYLSDIVTVSKIEFVWVIDYILLFIIFNSESNKLKKDHFCRAFSTRSPPSYR